MNHQTKLLALLILITVISGLINADPIAKWTFITRGPVYSSPTYFGGNIYVGSDDSTFYCLDALTGSKKWEFKTGGIIRCRPAVSDGNIYFDSDDGNLYSLNSGTGAKNWSYDINNNRKRILPSPTSSGSGNEWDYLQSSPCIDSSIIYIGSGDSCFYAIGKVTGNLIWKYKTNNIIRGTACTNNNYVFIGSWDGYIYSFSKSDGSVNWEYNTNGPVNPSPCIADSILYCGSRGACFCAINAITGKAYWKYVLDPSVPWFESSPRYANGCIYTGTSDFHAVLSFNTGDIMKVVWKCIVPGDAWSSPIYDNGALYIGYESYKNDWSTQAGGGLLSINTATGKINWKYDCGTTPYIGGVVSSPEVFNNVIYYGSLDGKVYAVTNTISAVDKQQGNMALPSEYSLQNYPNPFNPSTNISYAIPASGNISLKIYNVLGQKIATAFQGFQKAGAYTVNFDASRFASGVYLYRLQAGQFSETKTMVLMK